MHRGFIGTGWMVRLGLLGVNRLHAVCPGCRCGTATESVSTSCRILGGQAGDGEGERPPVRVQDHGAAAHRRPRQRPRQHQVRGLGS